LAGSSHQYCGFTDPGEAWIRSPPKGTGVAAKQPNLI